MLRAGRIRLRQAGNLTGSHSKNSVWAKSCVLGWSDPPSETSFLASLFDIAGTLPCGEAEE